MALSDSGCYIKTCPVGCRSELENSDIVLPEGPLKCCTACGQLVSSCNEELYWNSMKKFDVPERRWPSGKSRVRFLKRAKRIIERIESLTGKQRSALRLLDVGCSTGVFLSALKGLGLDGEGVEPAPAAAAAAVESGLKVYQGVLEELDLTGESFDVVTLFEVLEHLKDPLSLLRECYRIIRPSGLMVIRTGNTESWTTRFRKGNWEYFNISYHAGHISFYNPGSMRKLAQRSGFKVEELKTHRVRLHEDGAMGVIIYSIAKLCSELLNIPSVWLGKGHEMLAYLRKSC